jgi:hypothetical protein
METHFVDPDFLTFEAFEEWFLSGKIVHVFEYHSGLISSGPDSCMVEGPRPPAQWTWTAFVEYDENFVIKGVKRENPE